MAERPAFYALAPGGWRDYVTLLHPPYTLWHLGYVAIGAALAPEFRLERLVLTLAAFFLAMGVAAHALDELKGRPLATRIPARGLVALAAASLAGAVAIGIYAVVAYSPWLVLFVVAGTVLVLAYNLELAGGRLHTGFWFAAGWGSFPLLTGYFASAEVVTVEAVAAAVFAFLVSFAQRELSLPVRSVRRRVVRVSGEIELKDGTREPVSAATLARAPERALQALTGAVTALAAALVLLRL